MADEIGPPTTETTIAVVLGASDYPQNAEWTNPVLGKSAAAVEHYLRSPTGLALHESQVLDLFNARDGAAEQLLRIEEVLGRAGPSARDLVLYYVGHGDFDSSGNYCLGIRAARSHRKYTLMKSWELAETVRTSFGPKRIYVIYDSCFAASALPDWQGSKMEVAAHEMANSLPEHGIAFLAAASKDDVAYAPREADYTVFTGALMEALWGGVERESSRLSLRDLHEQVRQRLQRRRGELPELHCPSQREGDVSRLELFPNPGYERWLKARGASVGSPKVRTIQGMPTGSSKPQPSRAMVTPTRTVVMAPPSVALVPTPTVVMPPAVALVRALHMPEHSGAPPARFSVASGSDDYGAWAAFEVAGMRQRMRWIPPGQFLMGSLETEQGRLEIEGPQHEVTLTRGYWLGDTPVNQALWVAVMGKNPSKFKGDIQRPVETVSWEDCQAFLERLNAQVDGLAARLPTEAEWERACRGGTQGATWLGELTGKGNAPVLDAISWYEGNSRGSTHAVAGKAANPCGLYDMLGNVWEWCADARREYAAEPVVDPVGQGSLRVYRGGAWDCYARTMRAARRYATEPGSQLYYLGFRLAGGPAALPPSSDGGSGE